MLTILYFLLTFTTTCRSNLIDDIESAVRSVLHQTTSQTQAPTSTTINMATTSCTKLPNCNVAKSKPNAPKSQPNGCGSRLYGIDVPQFDFGSCCNNHDDCYSKCDVSFESCSNAFTSCMNHVCDQKSSLDKQVCQVEANVYSKAVQSDAACIAFRNNASNYCTC